MYSVFVDGSAGTTGLEIRQRLSRRADLSVINLPEERRKDPHARKEALNSADIVFLCLPDDAAREAVGMIENPRVRVIDTSTAHRVDPAWTYGFPELRNQRERIRNSMRIANPGCHASGFIALVAPLIEAGVLDRTEALACFSITGYTGGGKKMIAQYEEPGAQRLRAPRQYGLSQAHKHLPEMQAVCGLSSPPLFCPVVADFPRGMQVAVPLPQSRVRANRRDLAEIYRNAYPGNVVRFADLVPQDGFLPADLMAGYDDMLIALYGNDERLLPVALFDNLGKGASGAAVQNMNLLLGENETTGLNLKGVCNESD